MSDKPTTRATFQKPTLEEVTAYCAERQRTKGDQKRKPVDPERFFDYYESNGWKVGKNAMKDWKAAVRNWERTGASTNSTKQGTGASWNDLDGIL